MQFRSCAVAVLGILAAGGGCGSTSDSQRADDGSRSEAPAGAPMNTSYKPGSRSIPAGEVSDEPSRTGSVMKVEMEVGYLDENDIQEAIERNWRQLTRCYQRAGQAQRYVGGEVRLRFVISQSGAVDDVHVVENALGNYAVERCLVVEGRKIAFRGPEGGKSATFEYPINFRSARELSVVDWAPETLASDISNWLDKLTPCPPLGPQAVHAVAYIESSGSIGSVGLVSAGPIDPDGGVCAIEQIRAWRLPGDPGHVVRTNFRLRFPDPSRAIAAPPASTTVAERIAPPASRRAVAPGNKRVAPGKKRPARRVLR